MLKSIRIRRFFGAIAAVLGVAAVAFAADAIFYPHPSGACVSEGEGWAIVTGTNLDGSTSSSCKDNNPGGLLWSSSANGRTGYNDYYAGAVTGCENLVEAGYSDWRLPTIKEIQAAATHRAFAHVSVSYDVWNIPSQTWTTFTGKIIWASNVKGKTGYWVNLDDGTYSAMDIRRSNTDYRCVRP
jgi:hypothetical protein